MANPSLHVWQVAFGIVTDSLLTREAATQQIVAAEAEKEKRIQELSDQLAKALAQPDPKGG